jgi:hypothetical protein
LEYDEEEKKAPGIKRLAGLTEGAGREGANKRFNQWGHVENGDPEILGVCWQNQRKKDIW